MQASRAGAIASAAIVSQRRWRIADRGVARSAGFLFEWTAGVAPTNPRSVFSLAITGVPGQPTQRNLTFSPRLPDRTYEAQYRSNLNMPWQPLPAVGTTDFRDQRTITDLRATEPSKLYRIQITKP